MNTLESIWHGLDWNWLLEVFISVIPALLCITLHELSHGLAALAMGDTTARDMGRLTLNPIRHIDIMGLIMIILFHIGWAKPVPVDMRRFKKPRLGMALTALAGPAMNILLSCVALFLYGLLFDRLSGGGVTAGIALDLLDVTAFLSLYLAIFNLLPIPPLDGSKLVFAVAPRRLYFSLMRYERYGMFILFAAVFSGALDRPLSAAFAFLYNKLFYVAEWGYMMSSGLY